MPDSASDLLYKERGEIFDKIDDNKGATKQEVRELLFNVCNLCIRLFSPLHTDISPQSIWKSVELKFKDIPDDKVIATKYELKLIFYSFSNKLELIFQNKSNPLLENKISSESAVLHLIENLKGLA